MLPNSPDRHPKNLGSPRLAHARVTSQACRSQVAPSDLRIVNGDNFDMYPSHTVDGRKPFRTTLKPLVFALGNRMIPELSWCDLDFAAIHSRCNFVSFPLVVWMWFGDLVEGHFWRGPPPPY